MYQNRKFDVRCQRITIVSYSYYFLAVKIIFYKIFKKYHTFRTVSKSNRKIEETGKFDTTKTHMTANIAGFKVEVISDNFKIALCLVNNSGYLCHRSSKICYVLLSSFMTFHLFNKKFSNFSAISLPEQVNFQRNDDEVRFVLDQHADFYSASSLKQQSVCRHVAPLGHIILILSKPVFALSP
jgi:hypothetical protein